eukprot:39317-Pleurochrysis_carterae.AAC.1
MDSMAMPVDAGVLSAVCQMMRINSRPLELQLSRSIARVATLSTVLRMWSGTSDGRVRCVGADDAPAVAAADLVRARTAAGGKAIERSNVGSSGEGEWRA